MSLVHGLVCRCVQDSWRACVSLIVGNGAAEEALSRCLIAAVQQPIRRHFALLTWDGVLDKVPVASSRARASEAPLMLTLVQPCVWQLCEFGNIKGKKVDTLPPFYEVK